MANLGGNFDATNIEPAGGPTEPLPTGWYNVMITDSEMKENKARTGSYLELTLKVMDGALAGRQAWDRLNLYNPNPTAVEIAQKTLSAICHAVGVMQVSDSAVLHGQPMMAHIKLKAGDEQYGPSNDIKGYAKLGAHQSPNGMGAAAAAPPVAAPPAFAAPAPPVAAPPAPAFTPPTAAPPAAAPPATAPAPGAAPPWATG